jgi:hypothetical protein
MHSRHSCDCAACRKHFIWSKADLVYIGWAPEFEAPIAVQIHASADKRPAIATHAEEEKERPK